MRTLKATSCLVLHSVFSRNILSVTRRRCLRGAR